MRVEYSKTAAKALQRMDKVLRNRIRAGIEGLKCVPPKGDIKPMEGNPAGRYRLRVGGYRVIYRYDREQTMIVLFIIEIGSRGEV